ncbi:MAG TPA: DEAD/DEAH box helicase [Vicinamibacteria bacterium]|nr:DEAD/DEAH box helicase [Vicinamibacteria bacterium]
MSFSHLSLHPDVLRAVSDLGFVSPTPIQERAIPPILAGRDVLGRAMTGSGKTAAFLLPILQRLHGQPRGTTRALVLTPTRELAAQIADDFAALARHTSLTAAAVYGGMGMGPQEKALRRGVDLIVATPGRLLDHFRHGYAALRGLEVLVIDEADRMLDVGFLPDIRRVMSHVPKRRQTLLFSATLPPEIVALARDILRDPESIAVGREATAPAAGVSHTAYPVRAELKAPLLAALVKRGQIRSVIAFTRTKHRANRLADYLVRNGVSAGRIHGNRSQAQRTQALAGLKQGRFPVLVATDIAARGIDVEALSHVVNFDVPNSPEDYVHRVGRTARAEMTGDAFLFVSPEEEAQVARIERAIGKRIPRTLLAGFDYEKKAAEKLEVPLGQRLSAIHAQRRPAAARRSAAPPPRRHRSGRPGPDRRR